MMKKAVALLVLSLSLSANAAIIQMSVDITGGYSGTGIVPGSNVGSGTGTYNTATGDLIKTIEHVSGSADEIWDQVTESTQFVASGVYILQVSNARDINNKDLPDVTEKFVIIR